MAMLKKSLLVLWVMVLIVTEAKHHARHRQKCTTVRGTTCNEDSDCACLNHHNSPLICNYFLKCKEKSFWDIIWRKLPCRRVYKSSCMVEDDCECSEAPLTCENNECVKAKVVHA
ncbi:uncharacterized protein LOC110041791 [Orbicella faveolata]|uniref:uncharacterized protein LOC110041791 n=1 Tax=Orbicella faveolata TaxID=48498 RepID=UPI0009E3D279|nr:uncharacterized protein LOC110041791 [Orbicella faveolata]